jgi:alkylation response protein AidB-like acyl-CoA dehydrogenase
MRIELTQQDQAFRDQVRHFFLHDYPPDIIRKFDQGEDLDKEDLRASQRAMFRKGWAGGAWPSRYGGCGWTPLQNYLFQSEMAAAGALHLMRHVQEIMIAPVIYTFGDEPLQQRFLHAIKSGDILFCQGYSEPGAGSDLAALTTRAIRSDDCYLVTGTKLWTTFAHKTDWIFCLVRTNPDARPQEGISFLLIDLNSPGITITPVITLDGRHEVNQVHFDEVRVPISNRVGEENKGWTYAKFLLLQERSGISSAASNERSLGLAPAGPHGCRRWLR